MVVDDEASRSCGVRGCDRAACVVLEGRFGLAGVDHVLGKSDLSDRHHRD